MDNRDLDRITKRINDAAEGLGKFLQAVDDFTDSVSGRTDAPRVHAEKVDGSRGPKVYTYVPKTNETMKDKVRAPKDTDPYRNERKKETKLYESADGKRFLGIVEALFGFGIGVSGLTGLIKGIIRTVAGHALLGIGGIVAGGLSLILGVILLSKGLQRAKLLKRYEAYVRELGKKTVIEIEKLASSAKRSVKDTREDLKKMISRGLFVQGHLDDSESVLITSDETYRYYLDLEAEQEKKNEKNREEEAELKDKGLSTEGIAIVREGQEYLQRIQRMNAELPGMVITSKLQTLEQVISRMLDGVKKQPDSALELRKMMNYYLPTVWSLLETYKQIDDEPVKTEEMRSTQAQIEETVDNINNAFVKLLDRSFKTKVMDVNADISVLNTMLKQDGLQDSEFTLKGGEK